MEFLSISIISTISIGSIGVSIAEKSWIGIVVAIVLLCAIMGFGFSMKEKNYVKQESYKKVKSLMYDSTILQKNRQYIGDFFISCDYYFEKYIFLK